MSVDQTSQFATTRWTLIAAAAGHDTLARSAMEKLAQTYWYPLYAYVRRCGHDAHRAEDLTQGFFVRFIEKEFVRSANPARGRFRSFLLRSLANFLTNEREYADAAKRAGTRIVSFDAMSAERRYLSEPADEMTPERLFERRWATTLLDDVLAKLRRRYAQVGKGELFDQLCLHLSREPGQESYQETAVRIGSSAAAVKEAAHRLRVAYGEALREEITRTVETPDELETELRWLFTAVSA